MMVVASYLEMIRLIVCAGMSQSSLCKDVIHEKTCRDGYGRELLFDKVAIFIFPASI
jgi:hypothetical protein